MKKYLLLSILIFAKLFCINANADEGMWLPLYLQQLNEKDMQNMGLKITAEDIFSVNKTSLKDAIVLFGRGCTGEVISDKGLILTNHHCGYGAIQSHSTVDNDLLTNGFWAMNQSQELKNDNLSVSFLVSMENVTTQALKGIKPAMSQYEKKAIIKSNCKSIEKKATTNNKYTAQVKPFFYGNEYYLFVYEVFKDVRLVGAPPSSIGKFGGETDNWMWPRHTGDFSVFRIYANKNNEPADYSADNVPYTPKKSLTISLKGVKENDFTFVYGYPGTTTEYLTSFALKMIYESENPSNISIRDKKLEIIGADMSQSDAIRIKYAAKYASIANYWKKWMGENRGLKRIDAIAKKKIFEQKWLQWVNEDAQRKQKYGSLLSDFEKTYTALTPLNLIYESFFEAALGAEIIKFAYSYNNLVDKSIEDVNKNEDLSKITQQLKGATKNFFVNYNAPTDKKLLSKMLAIYYSKLDKNNAPDIYKTISGKYKGNYAQYADFVFKNSLFVSQDKINKLLANYKTSDYKKIEKDPAFILANSLYEHIINTIVPDYNYYNGKIDSMMNIYMTSIREMEKDKVLYPDANSTLRITYGKVKGYAPKDGVYYNYYTTLTGVIEKQAIDSNEYKVSPLLKNLYQNKDYGIYGENGEMHTSFTATNHTSGGNSGSPVLNAEGQLIGINFDRVWEGTMSDLFYDPNECRNVSLDIRYCLFVIDKYAGAGYLLKEMNIVN
ncbi:MAG: serine protease [Bacteroidetes bacterium CG2_30_32_10]|nr:MAG: serine protease [Bacteroidetes bacterium CG2_30_32_10]